MRYVILFVLLPLNLWAAPSISGVSGTLTHGQTVTVSGADFGTGATLYLWDNFEDGVDGNTLTSSESKPWTVTSDASKPAYEADNNRTGSSLAVRSPTGDEDFWYDHSGNLTECFISFWIRWDSDAVNSKLIRFTHGALGSSYPSTSASLYLGNVTRLIRTYNSVPDGQDDPINDSYANIKEPVDQTWERWDQWGKESASPDGTFNGVADGKLVLYQQNGGEGNDFEEVALSDIITNASGATLHWKRVWFTGYAASGDVDLYWDDIYIASSPARVELGDNPAWASCTHREIQPASSWAAGSIAVTLNAGSFRSGTAYLFVIDQDNTPSAGYEVTLVDGSGASTGISITGGGMQ